jgi:hypothetical protein
VVELSEAEERRMTGTTLRRIVHNDRRRRWFRSIVSPVDGLMCNRNTLHTEETAYWEGESQLYINYLLVRVDESDVEGCIELDKYFRDERERWMDGGC